MIVYMIVGIAVPLTRTEFNLTRTNPMNRVTRALGLMSTLTLTCALPAVRIQTEATQGSSTIVKVSSCLHNGAS